MFFTDYSFFAFLPIVVIGWWLFPLKFKNLFLVVASYVFYGWHIPWIASLMLGITFLNWLSAIKIEQNRSKSPFLVAIILSLLTLAWFKYAMFVIENLKVIFPDLPVHISIFLPAGISFYVFQAIGYTIDVYKGTVKAERNFINFALFISFFPQLIAGPIERSTNLLKQITIPRTLNKQMFLSGVDLIFIGYVKKVVVADNVAIYVNMIFDLKAPSTTLILIGGIGFSIQILADFSAYTDLARGSGRLLGFELLENFRNPYLSASPPEFWRRWHISLSNFIRDYLYIPLGGSKVTYPRWILNMFIVWAICGLWHGAGWNFMLWGIYWGLLIIIYTSLGLADIQGWKRIFATPINYVWAVLGWILFRATDLSSLKNYFSVQALSLHQAQFPVAMTTLGIFLQYSLPLIALMLVSKLVSEEFLNQNKKTLRFFGYIIAIILLIIFPAEQGTDFYYFQF